MPSSIDVCLKLHKFFATKNSKLDLCKTADVTLEYISTMVKVSPAMTRNESHIYKQEYFEELLCKSITIRNMVRDLLSVIDEQIPRMEDAIVACKAEKERRRLEILEREKARIAENLWTAPVELNKDCQNTMVKGEADG